MTDPKILIQRADRLGDVIFTLPVLEALRKKYPNSQIDYLTSSVGAQLLSHHPDIHKIHIVEWNNGGSSLKNEQILLTDLKEQGYNLYVSLWNNPKMAAIGKKAGIEARLGDKSDFFRQFNYTKPVTQIWSDYTRHQIEFNLDILAPLGIKSQLTSAQIPIDNKSQPLMSDEFKKFMSPGKKRVFILCSTGGSNFPIPENVVKGFIRKCLDSNQFEVVLGGNGDSTLFDEFKNKPVLNLINKTTIPQVISAINLCDYFVGPDSGPTHLASFMNKPMLFFSSMKTNPPCRWGPLSSCFKILRQEFDIPTKKITTCDPSLSFQFMTDELMFESFMDLVYSSSSGSQMTINEVKHSHLLNSYRVLYLAKDLEDYKVALSEKDILLEKGLRVFVYYPETYSPSLVFKLFKLMNTHNINVVQGIVPSWLKFVLREYMGIWNQYIKPVFLPVTLYPGSSIDDLLEVYHRLYSKSSSRLTF
jgi:ADP-heptose:LPS heptosyltransferase